MNGASAPRFQATTVAIYALTVVIWGSTWIMMKFQLGTVAPSASLAYRYFLAGVLVLIGATIAGKKTWLRPDEQMWCALQGALMFSVNYWLTYLAAAHLTTGIVSVFFAGVSAMTMLIALFLYRRIPSGRAFLGACLGVAGTALVFWPEVAGLPLDGPKVTSGLLVTASVFLFACGGLVGARNLGAGIPRYATIGWSMVWGGLWMVIVTTLRGEAFGFETSVEYVASLLWLIFLGSGLVFVLYFILIERIGPERAAYATVMFPLVALVISTFAEGYDWPLLALVGVPLALIGNALVLWEGQASPAPGRSTPEQSEAVEWPINVVELPQRESGV
ncbi:MAG: DMT family transporter [Pseudomonadota bacterium]